jgi:hypothetical protein
MLLGSCPQVHQENVLSAVQVQGTQMCIGCTTAGATHLHEKIAEILFKVGPVLGRRHSKRVFFT